MNKLYEMKKENKIQRNQYRGEKKKADHNNNNINNNNSSSNIDCLWLKKKKF